MDTASLERNAHAYKLIFRLEITLRELIREELGHLHGAAWWKRGIPADVRKECMDACAAERSFASLEHHPHLPLYYSNFSSLRKTIEMAVNWNGAFQHIFVRKDSVLSRLTEVDTLRNKVAHNRLVSERECQRLELYVSDLERAIGAERARRYQMEMSSMPNIRSALAELAEHYREARDHVRRLAPLSKSQAGGTLREWWFDDEYLAINLSAIHDAEKALADYSAMPTGWGAGPRRASLVRDQRIEERISGALEILGLLETREGRGGS